MWDIMIQAAMRVYNAYDKESFRDRFDRQQKNELLKDVYKGIDLAHEYLHFEGKNTIYENYEAMTDLRGRMTDHINKLLEWVK